MQNNQLRDTSDHLQMATQHNGEFDNLACKSVWTEAHPALFFHRIMLFLVMQAGWFILFLQQVLYAESFNCVTLAQMFNSSKNDSLIGEISPKKLCPLVVWHFYTYNTFYGLGSCGKTELRLFSSQDVQCAEL